MRWHTVDVMQMSTWPVPVLLKALLMLSCHYRAARIQPCFGGVSRSGMSKPWLSSPYLWCFTEVSKQRFRMQRMEGTIFWHASLPQWKKKDTVSSLCGCILALMPRHRFDANMAADLQLVGGHEHSKHALSSAQRMVPVVIRHTVPVATPHCQDPLAETLKEKGTYTGEA